MRFPIKKYLELSLNILVLGIFVAVCIYKVPLWLDLFRQQGQILPGGQATSLLSNENISLSDNKKRLIVFWATWCGPCSVELGRINRLVANGEIRPEAVLAISAFENIRTVQATADQRKYLFPIAFDDEGHLSKLYKIAGTPTLILVNERNIIEWTTVGLSPTLELRLKNFFN